MAREQDVKCDENVILDSLPDTKLPEECASDIEAWEYNPSEEDQRLPHKYSPNRPVPLEHVHGLGVLTWKLDVSDWENNPMLEKIKRERGYKYWETKIVSAEAMEDYEEKIKMFFQEHMHSQEEIRLILDGEGDGTQIDANTFPVLIQTRVGKLSGYWDIRDYDDKWIRFRVRKGDLIVLPPGMFHRFTLDVTNYIEALLIYTEIPLRTQHGRSCEEEESNARRLYIENFLNSKLATMSVNKDFEVPASIEVPAQ